MQLLRKHQVLLIKGHGRAELSPRAVTVAKVAQSASFTGSVPEFSGNAQMAVVVQQGHLVDAQCLVGHGQVAMRRRF